MGAVVVIGDTYTAGWNQRKTHPKLKRWGYPAYCDLHAEAHALLRSGLLADGGTLVVARLLRNGKDGLAKPCPFCLAAAIECGVSRIVWTTPEGVGGLKL